MTQIIIRSCSIFNQPRVDINGDGDACQVSIKRDNGKEEVLFTGPKYSRARFEETGGVEDERVSGLSASV